MLVLRGAMTPATRREYAATLGGSPLSPRGRLAAGGRVPVRAPRRALGDRRRRADRRARRSCSAASASPRPDERALDPRRRCASTSPSTSRSSRRRERRPRRVRPRCCAATASTCGRASRSLVRSTTLAAPLLLAAAGRAARARAPGRCCASALPGQEEAFWSAAARDVHLDAFAPADAGRGRAGRRGPDDPGAGEHARAGRRRPRADGPRRPRAARRCARRRMRAALVRDAVADARAAPSRPAWRTAEFAAFVRRALFLDRPDPAAAWRELRARQDAPDRAPRRRREMRIEAEGTDLTPARRRAAPGSTPTASATCPRGEVFTGPHEDSAEGTIRFTIPSSPRGVEVAGVELDVPRRARSSAPAPSAASVPARDARHRPGRPPPRRARYRHQPRDRPPGRRDPASTRRSAAPSTSRSGARTRRRAAGTSQRRALGPDLRPARRRPAQRRRRASPSTARRLTRCMIHAGAPRRRSSGRRG